MLRLRRTVPETMDNENKVIPETTEPSVSENGKYKRLLSNTAILGLGTFGSKLLVFLLMPLYTACLSESQYSDADLIVQVANLMLPLFSCGICEGVFRFTMDRAYDKRDVFSTGFFVITAGSAVLLALSPLLSGISYFGSYTWLICLYVIASCYHSLFAQFARACGKTAVFSLQGILGTAVTIILNVLFLVVFKMHVTGYVLSVVLSDIVISLLLLFAWKEFRYLRPASVRRKTLISTLKYSIPLIPTTVFWWITNVADRFMVKSMIGSDTNGLYAAAYKIPTVLILASGIFIEAWQFSAVTERQGEEGITFFGKVFESFQGLMFMCGAILIALAKVITKVLFAKNYFPSWQYMPILIVATVFSSLVTFMGSVYLVNKKSILSFLTALIGAVANLVLNWFLIPTGLGANGAALATFASYFIVFVIRAISSRRHIPFCLHTVKLVINTLLVSVQTAVMLHGYSWWWIAAIASVVLIFAINAGPILTGAKRILRRRSA